MHTLVQNEATTSWASNPQVGDVLGGYRLTSLLGEGGMAKVFAAEQLSGGHRVAIKILSKERSTSPTASRNFAWEADAARRVVHPNVVSIDASAEHAQFKYHVMELIGGHSLRDLMEDEPNMSVSSVLRLARQIASALAAAHDSGIVHRDLKPENVMVVMRDGEPFIKLIDFGASKDLSQPAVAGEPIVGTPIYMAPEQMWGQGTTAATDVYAFGLLLYEMLAGKLPFKARKFVELRQERSTQEPTPLRVSLLERLRTVRSRAAGPQPMHRETVPAELEALIMTCLARSPEERPASMGDVLTRLAEFSEDGHLEERTTAEIPVPYAPRGFFPFRGLRQAFGYAAAVLAVFVSASTMMSDMHAHGPRDAVVVVASR